METLYICSNLMFSPNETEKKVIDEDGRCDQCGAEVTPKFSEQLSTECLNRNFEIFGE